MEEIKTVQQALREQAASELLVIEPGVSAEQALASLDRAYREGALLEGCAINRAEVGADALGDQPSYVWGMAMGRASRYLRQLAHETGEPERSLAEQPASAFDLPGVCERERERAAHADALYQQLRDADRARMADIDFVPAGP
ncbi:hypothetical protein [Geopseudomonas aromaticivorans]